MPNTTGTRPLSWYGDHAPDWLYCQDCGKREDECRCYETEEGGEDDGKRNNKLCE